MAKKQTKKEATAEGKIPLAWVEDQGLITVENPKKLTAKEYIEQEYPALVRSPDNMPALLMAILTEIVKGRLEHE